jgi:hypothetical protein
VGVSASVQAGPQHLLLLGLDRLQLIEEKLEAVEFTADLRLQPRRQKAAVPGAQRFQPGSPVAAERLVIAHPLGEQQTFDPVDVPDPLRGQRLAFPRRPAAVLLFHRRRPHHRAYPRLPAQPRQKHAQERFSIQPVRLCTPPPARCRNRRGIHNVAFDPRRLQRTVNPEAVKPGLMDHDNPMDVSGARPRLAS